MLRSVSVFLDFNLPNATTWFYFSFLLAMALFFKFSRILSVRNWDVITLFLLVPGFLLLQQGRQQAQMDAGHVLGATHAQALLAPVTGVSGVSALVPTSEYSFRSSRLTWLGYLWLLCGSGYFLLRTLFDLALVQRPALQPNLNFGGLAWLAAAMFMCLVAVAYRQPDRPASAPPSIPFQTEEKSETAVGRPSASMALAQGRFDFWVVRTFAVVCHLLVVLGLIVLGARHFGDASAGMAVATFYLLLPYTGLYVGQAHHVWPMALVVWALVVYRFPILSGFLLGIASSTAYFPALTFPVWLSFYWRRGSGRFIASFAFTTCLSLGTIAYILWGRDELADMIAEAMALSDWQPWKVPTSEGFWTGMHWAYRIPIFIGYLTFVLTTAAWPAPKNLGHVIALSAAILIGLQFWYADQGGVYVLWYLPLLALLVFRPNLEDRRPAPIHPEADWLSRFLRAVSRPFRGSGHQPAPQAGSPMGG